MRSANRLISTVLVLILLVGCSGPGPAASIEKEVVQSQKARLQAPSVSAADSSALAEGNLAFAVDLYHAVGAGDQNLFYSPYSISLALAMAYAGAKGETEKQMADTLHFSLPPVRLHPAFNALDQELASRKDQEGEGADGKGFRLNIVNDLWGQQDYTFLPGYLDLLSENYGAGMRLMDFKKDPEAARQAINDYISEKTEQRIKDLLAQGSLDEATRLVLTNAIYFNAAWMYEFDKARTENADFTRLDGSSVSVPMMWLAGAQSLNYHAGKGYQAVALPYEGGKISMVVLLPDAGNFASFDNKLDAARLQNLLADLAQNSTQVMVKMPGFQMENSFALGEILATMGMEAPTTPGRADFSGMDGSRDLYISEVVHKSFVKVDEAGTEAAAATAVIMPAGAMPMEPIPLTIDRPFLFLIVDQPTDTILFFGRVTDPQE